LTLPLCLALVELVALAELDELGEELPQPAAASPMQATDAKAAICAPRR
jgi:hypothetical protein